MLEVPQELSRTEVQRPHPQLGAWVSAVQLSEDAREAMQAWRRERPKNLHGEHRYEASQFGLSAEGIRDRFAAYRRRHDLD